MARRRPTIQEWPAWYHSPFGESAVFDKLEDVPEGWAKNPQEAYEVAPPEMLDHTELTSRLIERGIVPNGTWSLSYMKELLEQ